MRRPHQLGLTVVCVLLGMLIAAQLRAERIVFTTTLGQSGTEQAAVLSNLVDSNARLRSEVEVLSRQVSEHRQGAQGAILQGLVDELNRMKIVNGLMQIAGPGVEIRLAGPFTVLDIQDLVNELRNAGAEAIAVNGQRIVACSIVGEDGTHLTVNGTPVQRPYVLSAVGDSHTLETALLRRGGMIELLTTSCTEGSIEVRSSDRVVLPVFRKPYEFKYVVATP